MVKNPPSNAEDMGSTSGQGTKIPHATSQLDKPVFTNKDPAWPKNLKIKI